MTYLRPPLISEINDPDGHVEDCVVCSILMEYLASGGKAPATLAEAEAIRAAGGAPPTGGVSTQQAVAGTTKRYGFTPTIATTPGSIIAAAKPGQSLTVSGHLSNFPAGHRLRRWSPAFTGGHRIYAQVEDAAIWWIDPLGAAPYKGEAVTLAELSTFAQGGTGGTVAPLQGADMALAPISDVTPKLIDLPAGATMYAEDRKTPAGTTTARTGLVSPFASGPFRAFYFSASAGAYGVRWAAPSKVYDAPASPGPAPTALGPGLYKVG